VFEAVELEGRTYMTGDWQCQASHRRVLANEEIRVWNGFSYVKHYYARDVDGKWELAGIQPHSVLMADGHPGLVLGIF
jgi:scytalone dehydratase